MIKWKGYLKGMLWITLILVGLTLDSAIVMLNKGAQLSSLSLKNTVCYSLIFAVVSLVVYSLGFGFFELIGQYVFSKKMQVFISVAIVLCTGINIITKSALKKPFLERVDRDFDLKKLVRIALATNIDSFFVGGAISLYGTPFIMTGVGLFIMTFVIILISLRAGYSLGAGYQKLIGVMGGSLIVVFSFYLGLLVFILR